MKSRELLLTAGDLELMWQACEDSADKVIFVCAAFLGMRANEIASLEVSWIDFQQGKIRIPSECAKTKYSVRQIPYAVLPRPRSVIEAFFAINDAIGVSRQTIWRRIKKIASRAHIRQKITPHGLRACAAYRFAEVGLSAQALRQLMGWGSLVTAEHYIQASGRAAERELLEAVRAGKL